MRTKKGDLRWPAAYESPQIFHIHTAFQQALGVTYCSSGIDAGGGAGACDPGSSASGNPGEPGGCQVGGNASCGPGKGNSPCSGGASADANCLPGA